MSTSAPPAAPQGLPAPIPGTAVDPAGVPAPVPARRGRRQRMADQLSGTPGRMRIAVIVAVLASAVFALLGGSAYQQWGSALQTARNDAAQLVRVQTVQNDLVKADAAAATAYLAGSAGSSSSKVYDEAIAQASTTLAQAASVSADSAELATVVEGLTRYTGMIAQAEANNTQGLQVGAAYQRQAGTVLRSEIVPALERVSRADQRRIASSYDDADLATLRLVAAAILSLAGLGLVQFWLARRVHRFVNVPLAAATLAVLVGLVIGFVMVTSAANKADRVASGPYSAAVALASARTAAFDAKAQESLGLIARGNAASNEKTAQAQIQQATTLLDQAAQGATVSQAKSAFTAWVAQHTQVRKLDDGGEWTAARDLAAGGSTTAFTAFDTASDAVLTQQAARVSDQLGAPRTGLIVLGWLTVILGLFAAAASYLGISQRLEEYR